MFEYIAKTLEEFEKALYDDSLRVGISSSDINWILMLGYKRYEPIEPKRYKNPKFYKIKDDIIHFIVFDEVYLNKNSRVPESFMYVKEKCNLKNSSDLVHRLSAHLDIYDNFIGFIIKSNDIKTESMILYNDRDKNRDIYYYDVNDNLKKITRHNDSEIFNYTSSRTSDFYVTMLQFEDDELIYIELMIDGTIKSGQPLKEILNEMPTFDNFFNFDQQLTPEIKLLYEATVI